MGDQANFIVTQLKSSGPSHKRINNDRSLGGMYRVSTWEFGCACGGRDRLTSCTDEYLPVVNI